MPRAERATAWSPSDSWIAFEGRSTLHGVHGKATNLDGYIEANWAADGTVSTELAPRMHVEFPVEQLRSGNGLQDREMWKMIDSKRFPTGRGGPSGAAAYDGPGSLRGKRRRHAGRPFAPVRR